MSRRGRTPRNAATGRNDEVKSAKHSASEGSASSATCLDAGWRGRCGVDGEARWLMVDRRGCNGAGRRGRWP